MPKSFDEVHATYEELDKDYAERHSDHRRLRQFYHGKYWQEADEQATGLMSLFRDLRRSSEVGPDLKLVHNLLQEVVTKFQTYLSPLPMINVPIDPPMGERNKQRATLKERYLYGLWGMSNMNQILCHGAWYLALMGDCFIGAVPDPETNLVVPVLRSPEYAYPIPSFTPGGWDGVIFRWEVGERAIARNFADYQPRNERMKGRSRRGKETEPLVEFIEYHDGNEWARWADGVKLNGVQHDYGFNLFQQMKFIPVPDEVWGHGAVEQAVGMVEMGNALKSLMFQAVLENVFPRLILENPQKFPEEIDTGAGAVIGVNEGGKAYWLHPPTQLIGSQMQFSVANDQAVKEATFMPDVNFGNFNASIVTGKAINELQGAGTGSVVEMVQGVGMGSVLVGWNERAIHIGQNTFRDENIRLHGHITPGVADVNPKAFALNLKGKELQGSTRNEVVFQPYIGAHEKLVMGLQALSGGLVSKRYVREQIGIPDSTAMEEEIFTERIEEGVLAAGLEAMTQAAANPEQIEADGLGFLEGTAGPAPASPLGGAASPMPMLPPGAAPMMGSLPTAGPPPSQGAEPGPAESSSKTVTLDDAVAAFQTVHTEGRVFLIGEIVQRGSTTDDIEVAVTNPADRETLSKGLPQFAGMLFFTVVEETPREQFVEVTFGADASPQGTEPTPEELFA